MPGINDALQVLTWLWKEGGWLPVLSAAIGGLVQALQVPTHVCPGAGYRVDAFGNEVCALGESLNFGALPLIFFYGLVGAGIGLGLVLALLALGVRPDRLGIDDA